jgi:uncharacterized protein (TIGR02145 family)
MNKYNLRFIFFIWLIISFMPAIMAQESVPDSIVTDIDGNQYRTIKIGEQLWMAENLRTTHYRNGDPILTTSPDTLDYSAETEPEYQFVYNGNEENILVYGRLYTWYAAVDKRNICPEGWHLPTIDEFKQLDEALGGKNTAIGALKATGTEYWLSPNTDATNKSGFNALPGGWRSAKGKYGTLGKYGHWWASDKQTEEYAFRMFLSFNEACYKNHLGSSDPQTAWSVRCVKDGTKIPAKTK